MPQIGKAAFIAAFLATGAAAAAPVQSQDQFAAAVRNNSTSPSFVLVTIVNDRAKTARTGCISANFVKGALSKELDIVYDNASASRIEQFMLSSTDHVFHFSKQAALDNMPFRYTQADLDKARNLVERLGPIPSGLPSLRYSVEQKAAFGPLQWSPALACALIEKGYAARMDDRSGQIFY